MRQNFIERNFQRKTFRRQKLELSELFVRTDENDNECINLYVQRSNNNIPKCFQHSWLPEFQMYLNTA